MEVSLFDVTSKPSIPQSEADARAVIDSVDFDVYAQKAASSNLLAKEYIATAVAEYRLFLLLQWMNRDSKQILVPTSFADEVWHQHILDTRAYGEFCSRLLGFYLHHITGIDPDTPEHDTALRNTQELERRQTHKDRNDSYVYGGCGGGGSTTKSSDATPAKSSCTSCASASCGGGGGCGGGCGG